MNPIFDPATTETLLQVVRLVIAGGAGGSALAWLNHSLSKRRLLLDIWFAERQLQLLKLAQLLTIQVDDPTHSDQFKKIAASAMIFCGPKCRSEIVIYNNLLEARAQLLLGNEPVKALAGYDLEGIEACFKPSFEALSQAIREEILRQPPGSLARLVGSA